MVARTLRKPGCRRKRRRRPIAATKDYHARGRLDGSKRMAIGMPTDARRREHALYLAGALASIALIVAGFGPTFYFRAWSATPSLTGLLWAHGLLMSAWLALFLAQAGLVASGRIGVHRRLGAISAVLVPALVVVGVLTVQAAGRRGVSPAPGVTPLMFMAVPLVSILLFAVLVALALRYRRRRPDAHKRLMLLATLSILTPGIARIPFAPLHDRGLPAFFALNLLLVLACIAVDTWRHRRMHPAFGWGGAAVILSVPARIAMAGTAWWTVFAGWLAS
jgi:hypothetical protein